MSDTPELTPAAELASSNEACWPNESDDYRRARTALLAEEIALRRHMFWGDRYGQVKDPFGHSWSIGAPVKRGDAE